jgi:hypothetical protein
METLYHYCPTSSFRSIIDNRALWLSSLTLSNDLMEGRLVALAIRRIAEREGMDTIQIQRLQDFVQRFEAVCGGLGFCLSSDSDLLSQWRGYASDATGVSIGFSSDYLKKIGDPSRHPGGIGFILGEVEYGEKGHEAMVLPTFFEAKEYIEKGALRDYPPSLLTLLLNQSEEATKKEQEQIAQAKMEFSMLLLKLLPKIFFMKPLPFQEEKEWRLVSFYLQGHPDGCEFRASGDRIIPYRSFALPVDEVQPIREIVLGPKNRTPIEVIKDFLMAKGFGDVPVRASILTYR